MINLAHTKARVSEIEVGPDPYVDDGNTQLLVANPLKRYLLNSTTLKAYKYGPGGSLTLYISHDNPGPAKQPNWLPAPDGPLYSILRVYLPGDTVINGTWKKPQSKHCKIKGL